MRRSITVLAGLTAFLIVVGTAASFPTQLNNRTRASGGLTPPSGGAEFGDTEWGNQITECPQAGMNTEPRELRRRDIDRVEQLSRGGDDTRTNTEYSCFPQNETSVAINPVFERNVLTAQNDYRTLARQGFGASVNNGHNWYDAEAPPLSVPNGDVLDASGDPVVVFDREGIAYQASINFNRTDDENGITVQRSTNGGFTWTRPCVPISGTPDPDANARCGGLGDPRQPGDNVVTYFDDPDEGGPTYPPFDDKEWLAVGPRPAGVQPTCFNPVTRTPRACNPEHVGVDRLYVTWTRFEDDEDHPLEFTAKILISHSDDRSRSWSPPRLVSISSPLCVGGIGSDCDLNQFSVPTVHPRTGLLGVAFESFNTPAENQYLFVRSTDGGMTFQGPFYVTPVFDLNYPESHDERPDCAPRGQGAFRAVLTNTCFRVNSGGNVVVDKRGGAFADDFYLTMSDNRNGTSSSSNTDVFFFRSTDGGTTWIGPSRVNTDRSSLGGVSRNCAPGSAGCLGNFGNDQWFPWMDVNGHGVLAFGFHDRRLDQNTTASAWPSSRQRPGNYLAWFWGAGCRITQTATPPPTGDQVPPSLRQCASPGARLIRTPTAPIPPGPDPVPGQGNQYVGPFDNQVISDVPHNLDYSFRAGIFMGDYNAVGYVNEYAGHGSGNEQAAAFWTDSRNGRGSQPGRNPACEQSDVFFDWFNPLHSNSGHSATREMHRFAVTPCPGASGHFDDDDDDD